MKIFYPFGIHKNGDGIYYEIKDRNGEEIDGGTQLYGLENTRDKILQTSLVNSLLKLSGLEPLSFERLSNGDLEELKEDEESL